MIKPVATTYAEVLDHINPDKPVVVYRNLHRKCLSIRQGGIVRCHAQSGVCLYDVTFVVNESGREKVRREKKKNVHAFVKGFVRSPRKADSLLPFDWIDVYYNPYTCDHFKSVDDDRYVKSAEWVDVAARPDNLTSQILAFNVKFK